MKLPSITDLRARLWPLSQMGLFRLAEKADVPYGTLDKIRRGVTKDPHYSTVAALWRVL